MFIRTLVAALLTLCTVSASGGELPVVDIPRVDGVTVDGDPTDWRDAGYRIDVLTPFDAETPDGRHHATVRLAWSDKGLLALVTLRGGAFTEADAETALFNADSVEFFISDGDKQILQYAVAPGLDPRHPQLRWHLHDQRPAPLLATPDPTFVRKPLPAGDGCTIEALIPLGGVGLTPADGRAMTVQVIVNETTPGGRAAWGFYPASGAWASPNRHRRIRLAATASPPARVTAVVRQERFRRVVVDVRAAADIGTANAQAAGADAPAIPLTPPDATHPYAHATIRLPLPDFRTQPAEGTPYTVSVANETVTATLPPLADLRARVLRRQRVTFDHAIFAGVDFPPCEVVDGSLLEDIVGPYRLVRTFYNAAGERVDRADAPGRYGAVVEARVEGAPADAAPALRREITLFRAASDPRKQIGRPWVFDVAPTLPPAVGIDPVVIASQRRTLGQSLASFMFDTDAAGDSATVMLAGLHDAQTEALAAARQRDPATTRPAATDVPSRPDPWQRNASWWFELRRRQGLETHRYKVYTPPGYAEAAAAGKTYPMILFLHGSGERGNDLARVGTNGPPVYVAAHPELPFIVVSPQCPDDDWWGQARILSLLAEVKARYRVDPDRVYLTGLSMGGFGTFETAAARPDLFAAIAPVCGGGNPLDGAQFVNLPTWIFHGERDGVVPVALSKEMHTAIQAAGARDLKITLYPLADHNCWDAAYATPELYTWFLAHRRNAAPPAK